jgi:hypothetical protein
MSFGSWNPKIRDHVGAPEMPMLIAAGCGGDGAFSALLATAAFTCRAGRAV